MAKQSQVQPSSELTDYVKGILRSDAFKAAYYQMIVSDSETMFISRKPFHKVQRNNVNGSSIS